MFRSFTGETHRALVDGDPTARTISAISHMSDFAQEFRFPHPILIDFLSSPGAWKEAIDSLKKDDSRAGHAEIIRLLRSTNNDLHDRISWNANLVRAIFESIGDLSNPCHSYTAGTIARLFTRAFDRHPLAIAHLFEQAPDLVTFLAERLEHPVIWQTLKDVVAQPRPEIAPFIFQLFALLIGRPPPDFEAAKREVELVYWVEPLTLENRTDAWGEAALEVLSAWFAVTVADTDDFRRLVLKYMPCIGKVTPAFFRLARAVIEPFDADARKAGAEDASGEAIEEAKKVAGIAVAEVQKGNLRGLLATDAFALLELCPREIGQQVIVDLVRCALKEDPPAHFALRSAVALVTEAKRVLGEAPKEIEKILWEYWNAKGKEAGEIAAACLDMCAIVKPRWAQNLWPTWDRLAKTEEMQQLGDGESIDFTQQYEYV